MILTSAEKRLILAQNYNQYSNKNAAKQPSYYMMLKDAVLSYVTHYRADFTKHDRNFFRRNPNGCFLYGMRISGTDIINLDADVWRFDAEGERYTPEETVESKETAILWLTTYNKVFYLGYTFADGIERDNRPFRTLTKIDKSDCIRIINQIDV